MANTKKIKLNNLLVNPENYRFETVSSQKEAIDFMIQDQDVKLFNLAEHILENGLNPNDKIQVIASNHEKGKYIVVEGNRRTISLKLANNPNLIDASNRKTLKTKFSKLHYELGSKLIKDMECTVYDNPSEADIWIKIKHAGAINGIGTERWTGLQVDRFEESSEGKSSIALQTIKLLQKSSEVPNEIKQNISKLKITNLNRLIGDPDVRDFLGIKSNNGVLQSEVDEKEVIKGLSSLVKDLLDPNFGVSKIYTKEDRKDYINGFTKTAIPDKTKKASKPWQFSGKSVAKPKTRPKPNPKDRKYLIPRSCNLKINNARLNTIYYELQRLDITKFTNAGAVLFRVFIELSIDSYLEEHKLVTTPSSAKSGIDFQQKVFKVVNHLESKKQADAAICKGIKVNIKNKNDLLGLDTWHAYVHNNKFSPIAAHLIITWDGMQEFMTILWDNIK